MTTIGELVRQGDQYPVVFEHDGYVAVSTGHPNTNGYVPIVALRPGHDTEAAEITTIYHDRDVTTLTDDGDIVTAHRARALRVLQTRFAEEWSAHRNATRRAAEFKTRARALLIDIYREQATLGADSLNHHLQQLGLPRHQAKSVITGTIAFTLTVDTDRRGDDEICDDVRDFLGLDTTRLDGTVTINRADVNDTHVQDADDNQ